ncbi:MAG TPA: ATP-binding domain-containing protein [Solirubrobacteraceae bacterium]|nr:ATP-binding domain-containing protein [Solirubrobacteraceae bacterium]
MSSAGSTARSWSTRRRTSSRTGSNALGSTLRDPEQGSIWLFLDDNQRIYDADLRIPPGFMHYDLTVNCRNTQAIHEAVMAFYEGDIELDVKGPPGREVVRWSGADVGAALAGTLEFLVDREEVLPQDIVVLSSHALERSGVAPDATGRFTFTRDRGKLGANVHFSSIRAFKGLESPVVVLVETEDLDPETRDRQMYVAISRARNHCVILERGS